MFFVPCHMQVFISVHSYIVTFLFFYAALFCCASLFCAVLLCYPGLPFSALMICFALLDFVRTAACAFVHGRTCRNPARVESSSVLVSAGLHPSSQA
jgi:hypothetical protein